MSDAEDAHEAGEGGLSKNAQKKLAKQQQAQAKKDAKAAEQKAVEAAKPAAEVDLEVRSLLKRARGAAQTDSRSRGGVGLGPVQVL